MPIYGKTLYLNVRLQQKHHVRLFNVGFGCPFEAEQVRFMGVMGALTHSLPSQSEAIQLSQISSIFQCC